MQKTFKKFIPSPLKKLYWKLIDFFYFLRYRNKTNKEIFKDIYINKRWGDQEFYSGDGSNNPEIFINYINKVNALIRELSKTEEIHCIDLGCGDFNIGSKLIEYVESYTACDIVDHLIDRNITTYKSLKVNFRILDIVNDEIPSGNLIIIRQVLQHLCNDDINRVLKKISRYKYIICSEHIPNDKFIPNLDKKNGPNIRLSIGRKGSGVVLTEPPFNFFAQKTLLIDEAEESSGKIQTIFYQMKD